MKKLLFDEKMVAMKTCKHHLGENCGYENTFRYRKLAGAGIGAEKSVIVLAPATL